ncbi:putative holin-like toxin [Cytobacillus solani]|uniref:putative holin-like toxin n=1 Tax=Cytobacillus solani TaxID=1637975 RepID=UPI000AF28BBF|nr:putative holin-like toxin [Cytobacillus solani]
MGTFEALSLMISFGMLVIAFCNLTIGIKILEHAENSVFFSANCDCFVRVVKQGPKGCE